MTFFAASIASGAIVYDSMPSPIPSNTPSLGYQATGTGEFGNGVVLSGGATNLASANILLSNWALESTYQAVGTSPGFNVPMTLNLYNVGPGNTVGSLISSVTATQLIGWRPEADASCTGGRWMGSSGCVSGISQVASFDLGNVAVPGQFIWGLVFDTQSYGPNKIGVEGPYNSLNVGSNSTGPSVGDDLVPGSLYWNTAVAGYYSDSGVGGVGTFRLDGGWSGFVPGASFASVDNVPEPATIGLTAAGLGIALLIRRRRA